MSHTIFFFCSGPEIDSPDKEKRASIEELISDVSGLNLDHAHSPAPSRTTTDHTPSQVQCTDGVTTITKRVTELLPGKCGTGPPTQKTATVYETIC